MMKRCEHCLIEVPGACPDHPHAELLDPENPRDQQWLAVLHQRRRHRRWQIFFVLLVVVVAAASVAWPLLLALLAPLLGLALLIRPVAPQLPEIDALLSTDLTERAARPRRAERSSGRRPEPGRVTVAG